MDLYTQRLDIVGSVSPPGEVRQVELNLVPAVIQPHWHCADEWLHPRRALIVTRSKSPANIFIIQHLDFKCKILLEVLDDHHKERKFNAQSFLRVSRTRYVGRTDIRSFNLQHLRVDVIVCDPLDMTVPHLFLPYLERFAADAIKNR